jgi:hypothetical protein
LVNATALFSPVENRPNGFCIEKSFRQVALRHLSAQGNLHDCVGAPSLQTQLQRGYAAGGTGGAPTAYPRRSEVKHEHDLGDGGDHPQ